MLKTLEKTHNRVLPLAGILFCFMLFCGCRKETPLPQATQTGANTLGCRINGKVWVAQDSDEMFNRTLGVEGGYQGTIIDSIPYCIWIRARRNDRTFLHLFVRKVSKPGLYPLELATGARPGALVPYSYGLYFDSSKEFMTGPGHTGTVTVTRADTINGIVSGTFEFTGYDPQTKQAISVTEGRFDARVR